MFSWGRKRRRAELLESPHPPAWDAVVRRRVPYAARLASEERAELMRTTQVLVSEKRWEGAAGLEITDEHRVTIASQAAVLLLGLQHDYYPGLRSIIVYPHVYRAPSRTVDEAGVTHEGPQARAGESWHAGTVVLAWDAVVRGAADPDDARNVVFHEFAHQLDAEQPRSDGAPRLRASRDYSDWARVLGSEFAALKRDLEALRPVDIDPYGATNAAEFFAVVTETFFERPRSMRRRHRELYDQLARFHGQDPAER